MYISSRFGALCSRRLTPQPATTDHVVQPIDGQRKALLSSNEYAALANAGSPQSPLLSENLQPFSNLLAMRTRFVGHYGSKFSSIFLRCGYVILRKRTPVDQTVYEVLEDNVGYGVEVTLKLLWRHSRLSLLVFVTKQLPYSPILSLNSKINFLREIPRNAIAVTAVREGNIETLLKLFKCKQAGPSDTLPNGSSLLHVGLRSTVHNC